MNKSITINTIIDNFNALLLEEKEFALDLIKKAFAESEREAIYKTTKKATANYKKGNVKSGNVQDLYNDLEND